MKRLDFFVAEQENISRNKAQSLIKDGLVSVNGKTINKPAIEVDCNEKITIKKHDAYVSRGAYKLVKALDEFGVDLMSKTVLDMGASTGGFTQVALSRGAEKVYAVDVGRGELDKTLATNPRVVNMEGCDVRTLKKEDVNDVDIVVGDMSFISLKKVLPHIKMLFGNIEMILLFKPQFECGKEIAKKYKGVIKDKNVHKKLLKKFFEEIASLGVTVSGLTFSPIKGGSGNIEYLLHLNGKPKAVEIENVVEKAFCEL